MKTSFFYYIVTWLTIFCSGAIVVASCFYSWFVFSSAPKSVETFYFVVEQTDNVEMTQSVIAMQGGAGYVFPSGEVALSVYSSYDTAQTVLDRVQKFHDATYLLSMYIDASLDDGKAFYVALRCVEDTIERLEHGLTQNKAAYLLTDLGNWFFYYGMQAKGATQVSAKAFGEELLRAAKGVIYVNELRYFLCKSIADCAREGEKIFLEG